MTEKFKKSKSAEQTSSMETKNSKDPNLVKLAVELFQDGHYIASVGVLIDAFVSSGMLKKIFRKEKINS